MRDIPATGAKDRTVVGNQPGHLTPMGQNRQAQSGEDPGGCYRYPLSQIQSIRSEERPANRAIFYARVSSVDQRQDLEEQMALLRQKAQEMGLVVVSSLQDIASSLNESRRGLLKVIESAVKRETDCLLITYRDRLTRFGFKTLQKLLAGHGIQVSASSIP